MGLVLLRAALCAYSVAEGVSRFSSEKSGALAGYSGGVVNLAIGAFLLAGFLTPVAGFLSMLSGTMGGLRILPGITPGNLNPAIFYLVLVLISAAIVLLGPGAFSLDARIFGRREIIIPQRKSPRPDTTTQ